MESAQYGLRGVTERIQRACESDRDCSGWEPKPNTVGGEIFAFSFIGFRAYIYLREGV